jgi:DNA-directed RNA polymerase subunit beta
VPDRDPEGSNIGLISSLALYATLDAYGFLVTPYRVVRDGRLTDEVMQLRADEESGT